MIEGEISPVETTVKPSGYTSPDVDFADASNQFAINNDHNLNNGGTMKNSKKDLTTKWWTWAVVAAVLVGIAIGGYYWSERNKDVITATSSAGQASNSGLLEYKDSSLTNWTNYTSPDTKGAVSFSYDSGWKLVKQPVEADLTAFLAKTANAPMMLGYEIRQANKSNLTATTTLTLTRVEAAITVTPEAVEDTAAIATRTVKVGAKDVTVTKMVQTESNGRRLISHNALYYVGTIQVNVGLNVSEESGTVLTTANETNIQAAFDKLLGSLSIKE